MEDEEVSGCVEDLSPLHLFTCLTSLSVVIAPSGAGLAYGDAVESLQLAFETFPYPASEVFARRVFKPFDFVEVVMIESLAQRLERFGYLGVIDEPAHARVDFSAHSDFASERVAVQSLAFMSGGNVGQTMRRFEREFLYQFDNHSAPILSFSSECLQMIAG